MKVIILAAVTADGFIAKDSDHLADWTSPEDKKHFVAFTKQPNTAIVMGSKTFDTIGRPLPGREMIVHTRSPQKYDGIAIQTTQDTAGQVVSQAKEQGIKRLVICGGAQIYDQYLQSGQVNELCLTIEPVLFGDGVQLFQTDIQQKMELLNLEKLNDNSFVVNYLLI